MALRAGTIIEGARFRHPQFTREVIPTSVACNFLSDVQYQLLLATHQVASNYLIRRWVIAMLPTENIATVGAGSAQGAPLIDGTLSMERSPSNAGALAGLDSESAVLSSERAITGAGASTLTDTTQVWTVDLYVGERVRITTGPGIGQVREIASNTADTLTVTEAWSDDAPSTTDPAFTSTYVIEQNNATADGALGALVGALPVTTPQVGWLVKLDAGGQPYLDLVNPISVPTTSGIPLPPNHFVDHGVVYIGTGNGEQEFVEEFTIIAASDGIQPPRRFCGWVEGQQLFLAGPTDHWRSVRRIEVKYLPLAPDVTAAGDLLMLPDAAKEALIGGLATRMLERAQQLGVAGDSGGINGLVARGDGVMRLYLDQVKGRGRATVGRIREVW